MIKVALFDLDGVLVSSEKIFSKRLVEEYGTDEESISQFFNGVFSECLVGKADMKEEIREYAKRWRWNRSIDDLLDYWFSNEANVDERLLSVIKELRKKGIKCYLATNQEKYRTAYIDKEMGFSKIFDGIFSSSLVGCLKNRPEFFEYVLTKIGDIKPEEVLFVDDSQDNIEVAQDIGIQTELYTDFSKFKKKLNSFLLDYSKGCV